MFPVFAAGFLFSSSSSSDDPQSTTTTSLDAKVDRLFDLFDFDGNQRLNRVEMEMLFECVAESIHGVTQTEHPNPGAETLLGETKKLYICISDHKR